MHASFGAHRKVLSLWHRRCKFDALRLRGLQSELPSRMPPPPLVRVIFAEVAIYPPPPLAAKLTPASRYENHTSKTLLNSKRYSGATLRPTCLCE